MIVTRPDDWSAPQVSSDANKTDIYRFPDGQEYSDWTEMLRQEVYNTTAGMETAERVYELRSAGDQENCPNYTSEVREQEPENGYSMIVWRQSCTPAEDVIFSSLHKVVLGNDRLYILEQSLERGSIESNLAAMGKLLRGRLRLRPQPTRASLQAYSARPRQCDRCWWPLGFIVGAEMIQCVVLI